LVSYVFEFDPSIRFATVSNSIEYKFKNLYNLQTNHREPFLKRRLHLQTSLCGMISFKISNLINCEIDSNLPDMRDFSQTHLISILLHLSWRALFKMSIRGKWKWNSTCLKNQDSVWLLRRGNRCSNRKQHRDKLNSTLR
jgi:hypothetical protein